MTSPAPRDLVPGAFEPDVSRLVTEDDTPVDNILSEKQMRLLTEPLYTSWAGPPHGEDGAPRPFLTAANVGVFAALHEPPLVPDVFLSVDVSARQDLSEKRNRSYFFWEYGKPPDIVIEVVSNTEGDELGRKRRGYARMRIAYYAVWDPDGLLGAPGLSCFELRGDLYVPAPAAWFDVAGLGLARWHGAFEGVHREWLRWCERDGRLIPTGEEQRQRADEERQRADEEHRRAGEERQRADEERQRADRLAARLRAMGVDPDEGT